ncbi:MAG: hypothetical protein ACRCZI_11375 [Cetobacterium sp.]
MSDDLPGQIDSHNPVGNDERLLLSRLRDMRQEAERHKDEVMTRTDNLTEEDDLKLYRGEVGPKDRLFDANFVQAFIDRMVAGLTDNRPTMRIEHRKLGLKNVARVLEKTITGVWQESDLQRQTFKMCYNAAINRSAGLYTGYDSLEDEIFVEVLRKDQVLVDPLTVEAGFFDRAEYLFIKRVRPVSDLKRRFPGRATLIQADAPVSTPQSGRREVDSPLPDLLKRKRDKDLKFARKGAVDRAIVWEGFVQDRQLSPSGEVLFPTYRHLIFTDDVVLSDGPLEFWDGRIPIDWFDWGVDPEHPWGWSEPMRLRRLQTSFNMLVGGLIENQILTNFISIILDDNVLDSKQMKQLSKVRNSLILRKSGGPNKQIQMQPPPTFGSDKVQIGRMLFTFAQLLCGITDVTLGENPGSLQSGQAIEGLQEGANLMTRARASRLEDFFTRVGNKLVSRIFQFVTADRVFQIMGPTGDALEYAFQRNQLFLNDDGNPLTDKERKDVFRFLRFSVLPGSSAPGSRMHRAQLAMQLNALGLASGKYVLEAADFPDPDGMINEAKAWMAERAAMMPQDDLGKGAARTAANRALSTGGGR